MAASTPGTPWSLILAATIAAVGGGGLVVSTRAPPPVHPSDNHDARGKAASAAGEPAAPVRARGPHDALAVLEGFAGGTDAADGAVLDTAARAAAVDRQLRRLGYHSVRVLLATVPDPDDSRFVKLFDDVVGAIRTALERSGFVDDRFSDPWRQAGAGGGAAYRRQPAVMLFRREDPKEVLALLLVGETPTRGVHRRAMRAALDVADAVAAASCAAAAAAAGGAHAAVPFTLSVLGPTMSGTAESLRTTIVEWFADQSARPPGAGGCRAAADPPFDLELISGTATADSNRQTLGDDLTRDVRRDFPAFTASFQATVHPDSEQQAFVIDYLAHKLGACRIALLSESSTTYGQQAARGSRRSRALRCGHGDVRIIDLPFPLHVSKLRVDTAAPGAGDVSAAVEAQPPVAEHQDADDQGEGDAFPAKSRVTQATSAIALAQGLRTIATEDVEAVVIAASSTADELFLIDSVRRSFPNVTIVVNEADLVYLRGDVPFMEGVLVASSYPLQPWAQRVTFPFEGDETLMMFPSSSAEGAYNAALLLLDDLTSANLLDYSPPFVVPGDGFAPALWMSVISRGAFWPLAASPERGGGYVQLADPVAAALDAAAIDATVWTLPRSVPFLIATCALIGLDLLLIAGYARRRRLTLPNQPTSAGGPTLAHFPHPHMERFEIAALFLVASLLSGGFLLVGVVTALPPAAEVTHAWTALLAALGAATVTLGAFTALAFTEWAARAAHTWRARRVPLALAAGLAIQAAAVAAAAPRLWALRHAGTEGARIAHFMFFVERARNLDGGVSVLWMAALLAVGHVMWIAGHLRQVRIVEDARALRAFGVIPTGAAVDDGDGADADAPPPLLDALDLTAPMRAAAAEAEGVLPSRRTFVAMAAVTVTALWIARGLPFFEGCAWGVTCAIAYACLLALLVYGCTRYLRTWHRLQEVLAKVAPLPVTEALGRIPIDLLTSFKRPWDSYVFAVWQRHCQAVFARLRGDPKLLHATARALAADKARLQELMAAPVAAQIEGLGITAPTPPATDEQWAHAWEDFLAMRLVAFVQYIRTHLANFVAVSTAALLPALWATNFYPLRENRFLLGLVLAVTGAAIAVTALVFVQMNRNYVLSKLDNRESPGRVTWDRSFVTSMLVHVALPLVALLAVKFPELGRAWQAITAALSAAPSG